METSSGKKNDNVDVDINEVMNGDGKSAGRLSVLHDLYVDLLGSLVPGLVAVILGGTAIFLALSTLHVALFNEPMLPIFSDGIGDIIGAFHWEFATVIIVSAYVIGAAFFRQDPKRPDASSALHVWMNSRKGERNGLAVQAIKELPNSLALSAEDDKPSRGQRLWADIWPKAYINKLGLDTQFPYLHLRCYLVARGLIHLIRFVPWCPLDKDTRVFRTKMFINIFKIRLLSNFPHISRDIIRNEAHVRLATSVWYASSLLVYLSAIVFIFLLVIRVVWLGHYGVGSSFLVSFSFALLLFLFCLAMCYHLRKCIHYMRVREVIYVLETAYLAEQVSGKQLFVDLTEKEKCTCMQCGQMKPSVNTQKNENDNV